MDEKTVLRVAGSRYEGALRNAELTRLVRASRTRRPVGRRMLLPLAGAMHALGRAIEARYEPVAQ